MANKKFKIVSKLRPAGDQPAAIRQLVEGLSKGYRDQTLLGVTGSGKTFAIAKVIEKIQKPTLVIAHNKTLAAQLAAEFRDLFPDNAVHYFVSYYDYYQPEAYIPKTDTYIAKDASINEEIDKLRHAATQSLLTRKDVLIVASVSCIYGIGSPEDYQSAAVVIERGKLFRQQQIFRRLVDIQYQRNDINFTRGTFRARGEVVEIFPSYSDFAYRVEFSGDTIEKIRQVDYLTGEILGEIDSLEVYPAKHFITPQERLNKAPSFIEAELKQRVEELKKRGKLVEAQRLEQRTNYDLEMLREVGYVSGIENYSRYLGDRAPGEEPATLLDYFPSDFLMVIDESHMTIPQVRGMYRGDRSRKETLVEHGFRLPSALDNRPLTFDEFRKHIKEVIYTSATPDEYELELSDQVVEQIVRPTGLVDPGVEIRPTSGQIDDLMSEIDKQVKKNQRVLVTTLTKKTAEDLTDFLLDNGIKVQYLHSDVGTLERIQILKSLRLGEYDVVVGINLLREGLDLPEVSLVAILDADKEGFLRSKTALIQTFGRAARHIEGQVIMYADKVTLAMQQAINESDRRRDRQLQHNRQHKITPRSITKKISTIEVAYEGKEKQLAKTQQRKLRKFAQSAHPEEVELLIADLASQMDLAAKNLDFEQAAELRDEIELLQRQK
ncbi:excinuclease ABC subunit B [candidate division Kazan bacterium RBG_13_50_9]|uniref:UvrABC system protein B n=1 Tax=candidate division Kazan bacterium RBG_13_50_9 TaxID=1798535 RepID=A0A1F4NR99_UNCK3|nr:MAG: excinuclease ABC subunit B [candidate division Kazan bacterium RBG_13_50_9]